MAKKPEQEIGTADREILVTRILNAPRELVFKAWTDPNQIQIWWGPKGFTTTHRQTEFRPGGVWRFVMHGPDGRDYDNRIVYEEIIRPERLVYIHDGDIENDPHGFRVTVTFEDLGGKTRLTMRSIFKSAAERDMVVKEFGTLDGANQTLDRLEALLPGMN
jgi:uncharacterized protein YndB with AHSA1/START domain